MRCSAAELHGLNVILTGYCYTKFRSDRQQNYSAFYFFCPAMQHRAQTEIANPINRKSHSMEFLFISGIRSNNVHRHLNMNTMPIINESSFLISFLFFILEFFQKG